jgi:hypothetical protein
MMKKLIKYLVVFFVMVVFFIQVDFFKKNLKIILKNNFLENKNLFSCGKNYCNQKGIFNNSDNLLIPTKIDFFKNIEIENLFTGYRSTFIKTIS